MVGTEGFKYGIQYKFFGDLYTFTSCKFFKSSRSAIRHAKIPKHCTVIATFKLILK